MYHSTAVVNTNSHQLQCKDNRQIRGTKEIIKLWSQICFYTISFLLFCSAVNTISHSPSIIGSALVICRSEPTLLQTCSTPGFSSLWNNKALYFVFRVMANLIFLWDERERAKTRMRMQTRRRKRNVFVLVSSLQQGSWFGLWSMLIIKWSTNNRCISSCGLKCQGG